MCTGNHVHGGGGVVTHTVTRCKLYGDGGRLCVRGMMVVNCVCVCICMCAFCDVVGLYCMCV